MAKQKIKITRIKKTTTRKRKTKQKRCSKCQRFM